MQFLKDGVQTVVKKEDAEFCGENLIVRKLNVCFMVGTEAV